MTIKLKMKNSIGLVLLCILAVSVLPMSALSTSTNPVTITVAVWDINEPEVRATAEDFNKQWGQELGIAVRVEPIAREVLREKEGTALMARTGAYDIVLLPSEWIAELAEGNLLESLDEYMADSPLPLHPDKNDWASPGMVEGYKYKSKLYGLPIYSDTILLFYRTDMFKQYGIVDSEGNAKPPETWEEYLEVAKKLTVDTDNDGKIDIYGGTIYGKLPESIAWDYINYLWSFGAEILDENYCPIINNKEGIDSLEYFVNLYRLYKVVPPGSPTYEYPEVDMAFKEGKVAMAIHWNAAYRGFLDPEQSPKIQDKWAATVLPGRLMPDGTILRKTIGHVWGFAMDASSKNKKEAYTALVYFTGKEGIMNWAQGPMGILGNSKAVLADSQIFAAHPEASLLDEAFKYVQLWPNTTITHDIILAIALEASEALAGTKTPQEALDDCATKIDKLTKKAGY